MSGNDVEFEKLEVYRPAMERVVVVARILPQRLGDPETWGPIPIARAGPIPST